MAYYKMTALTLIVLTYNEELHLRRCLKSVKQLNSRLVVVDSFSTDQTFEIAKQESSEIFQHPFINQALQFQWAMDNCDIQTEWVLRLDADETLDEELCRNINNFISHDGYGHNGAIFNRKHIFLGKWIKHGGRYPLPMLRLFRTGYAHIEQRWMDEHIVLDKGTSTVLKGGFSDDNLNPVSWFIDKHNKYATREMVDIKLNQLFPKCDSQITGQTGIAIRLKRFLKQNIYLKLPYFVRPFLYFIFRYFFQFGFLDGARGFAYHFMQGFWYRALVDLKCLEVDIAWHKSMSKSEKLQILEQLSGYKLDRE